MSAQDGGPAFPVFTEQYHYGFEKTIPTCVDPGMTLRDYFAASALQAMKLANSWCDNPLYWEGVARSAYVCADAMLIARSAK